MSGQLLSKKSGNIIGPIAAVILLVSACQPVETLRDEPPKNFTASYVCGSELQSLIKTFGPPLDAPLGEMAALFEGYALYANASRTSQPSIGNHYLFAEETTQFVLTGLSNDCGLTFNGDGFQINSFAINAPNFAIEAPHASINRFVGHDLPNQDIADKAFLISVWMPNVTTTHTGDMMFMISDHMVVGTSASRPTSGATHVTIR